MEVTTGAECATTSSIKVREHVDFGCIQIFITTKKYPAHVISKGEKANFRRATRNFVVRDNQLMYIKKKKDGSTKEVRG